MELLYCKQDFLLHGKEYISSQTVHSANSEPKLLFIVSLFTSFPPAHLLDFQKKIHPARLFHPARLLIFRKKLTLLVYSILLFYSILESIDQLYTATVWPDGSLHSFAQSFA